MIDNYLITLPGGLFLKGILHRKVYLRKPNGHIEESIERFSNQTNLASIVTEILANCIIQIGSHKKITTDLINNLQIGDRNYLMLKLREITFGNRLDTVLRCPDEDCRKKMDISFLLSDMPVKYSSYKSLYYKISIKYLPDLDKNPKEIFFELRFPNGKDQELLSQKLLSNKNNPVVDLLKRCVKSIDGSRINVRNKLDDLPEEVLIELDKRIKNSSPGIESHIEATCPECYHKFDFQFNIAQLFVDELNQNLSQLYKQVHLLAFYYRWQEQEILSLDRGKRIMYAEMIDEQIEKTMQVFS